MRKQFHFQDKILHKPSIQQILLCKIYTHIEQVNWSPGQHGKKNKKGHILADTVKYETLPRLGVETEAKCDAYQRSIVDMREGY